MFENVCADQQDVNYNQIEEVEEFKEEPCTIEIFIPKVEPLCPTSINNESTSNVDEIVDVQIPFSTPYKVKDPVVLLERCDKIWETLKVIKNTQHNNVQQNTVEKQIDTVNTSPSKVTTSKSSYIKYTPVLGNNNTSLPDFKLSVKNKKKLFNCITCGKQYSENRALRCHSSKIHGIHIPLQRVRHNAPSKKNVSKTAEKEPNIVEKEVDNSEKVSLKKPGNKQHMEASLQSTSSVDNNTNLNVSDAHRQRKKRNSSIQNNNGIDSTEVVKNKQETLNKELKQNDVSSSLQYHSLSICSLCQQNVKDMRKHLIDYHKIESPDFMLKNLNKASDDLGSNKAATKKVDFNDNTSKENEITEEENPPCSSRRVKRKASASFSKPAKRQKVNSNNNSLVEDTREIDTKQCKICFGLYKISSYYKHLRNHRIRGETEENFHLSNYKYSNSPLYHQNNTGDSKLSKNNENKEQNPVQKESNSKISDTKYNNRHRAICSCGRLFRNPYTLYVHRKKCDLTSEVIQAAEKSNANRTKRYITRNTSGRDPSSGISITIKKKDNSYEIIDKDNGDQNNLKDHSHSNNTKLLSNMTENTKYFTYSKRHSVVKIESVNEDVDIDIEDDSQSMFCNGDISDSASTVINGVCNENVQPKIKIEPDDELYYENFNLDNIQKRLGKKEFKGAVINLIRKYNLCICGRKFYTKKALHIHIAKHHANSYLICGYCKDSFSDTNEWTKHKCSVKEGKKFFDIPQQVNCCYCSAILTTCTKFDKHIKHKHFNPVVPYQCFKCNKRFTNATSRKLHFDTNHKVTVCPICNNKFHDAMISRHRAYHYGLGFPCHVCKKTYTSKTKLTKHMARVVHAADYNSYESSFMYSTVHNL